MYYNLPIIIFGLRLLKTEVNKRIGIEIVYIILQTYKYQNELKLSIFV